MILEYLTNVKDDLAPVIYRFLVKLFVQLSDEADPSVFSKFEIQSYYVVKEHL